MRPVYSLVFAASICVLVPSSFALGAALSTTTKLVANPTGSVKSGTAVALSVTVADANSAAVTEGSVVFYDGKKALGTAQLVRGGTTFAHGTANLITVLGPGSHSISAAFNATTVDAASVSATQVITVTSSIATSSVITETAGSSGEYYLTGTLSADGPIAPTGSFHFIDQTNANYLIGSAGITGVQANYGMITPSSPTAPGSQTVDYAIADFNNDGIPDIAFLAGSNSEMVSIFLGSGTGSPDKQAGAPISVGSSYVITTGDFNNDGNTDFATLADDGVLYVYLGDGTGKFAAAANSPITLTLADSPQNIAVADFNSDGNLDIFALGNDLISVAKSDLLLGDGAGGFSLSASSPIAVGASNADGVGLRELAVADFDGNGFPDVVTNNGQSITVLLNDGLGNFALPGNVTQTPNSYAGTIAVGDFNGDGYPDVATVRDELYVFLNDTHGRLVSAPTPTYSLAGQTILDLAAADFNGDGHVDLVYGQSLLANGEYAISILAGDGTGNFAPASGSLAGFGTSLAIPYTFTVADFNGDGLPDLGVINYESDATGGVYALLAQAAQTATATSSALSIPGSGQHSVAANYPGDSSYAASTSATTALAGSTIGTTLSLGITPASGVTAGQSVTFTASIVPKSVGDYAPSGAVSFSNGDTVLGTGSVSGGSASFTTSSLAAGTYSVVASYPGDANFSSSSSVAVTITVGSAAPADFSIAASPTSATIKAGETATITFTVTPVNGFNTPVTFSCGALPAEANCSFSPASVTPGSGPVTSTMQLTTTAPTVSQNVRPQKLPGFPGSGAVGGGICLAALTLIYVPRRFRARRGWMMLACGAVLCSGLLTGCGAVKKLINQNTDPGSPQGTYTVTVSASAGSGSNATSHTVNVSIVIQ